MLPSDLYFFFETEDLSNASPQFVSQIGLVITQESDVPWRDLYRKHQKMYYRRHQKLGEHRPHQLAIEKHFQECESRFLMPMITSLDRNEKVKDWPLWNVKSLVL